MAINVAPLVGAWIESVESKVEIVTTDVAPLVGAWIESTKSKLCFGYRQSLLL